MHVNSVIGRTEAPQARIWNWEIGSDVYSSARICIVARSTYKKLTWDVTRGTRDTSSFSWYQENGYRSQLDNSAGFVPCLGLLGINECWVSNTKRRFLCGQLHCFRRTQPGWFLSLNSPVLCWKDILWGRPQVYSTTEWTLVETGSRVLCLVGMNSKKVRTLDLLKDRKSGTLT